MSNIVLKNVCKSYDKEHYAVQDFSLEIPDREFVIFVGPSGCGKSTTLRMIAGLEEITSGELWIDGQLCNYVEAKDRDLSMVFQNYALYPNMTVYENMAFSLKIRKQPKDEVDKKVHEAAKMLGIEHLLDRRPAALPAVRNKELRLQEHWRTIQISCYAMKQPPHWILRIQKKSWNYYERSMKKHISRSYLSHMRWM